MKTRLQKIGHALLALFLMATLSCFGQEVVTPTVTNACQPNNGSVTIAVTNGTGPFVYFIQQQFAPGSYFWSESPLFNNLIPGEYTLAVFSHTDTIIDSFAVLPVVSATSTVTNTTCPANAGAIAITATGGTGSYTYHWTNSATGPNLNNLAGGIYGVTITDGNGCYATVSDTVIATTSLTVAITNGGSVCNPSLTAVATGGTGSVSYLWSTGANTATITGLTSYNYYEVLATDANGCTAEQQSQQIRATSLLFDSSSINIVSPTCNASNGSISINMHIGTAPYTYAWSTGASGSTISGLAQGPYSLTITDANGCSGSGTLDLSNQSYPEAYFSHTTEPNCGQSNGALTVYAYENNQVSSYTYAWSNGTSGISQNNLTAGTYVVTITDASGCTTSAGQTLTAVPDFQLLISTTPTACDTALHSATATVMISGNGTPPYNILWIEYMQNTGEYDTLSSSQTISGLGVNTELFARVTDATGCMAYVYDTPGIQLDPSCYDHITGYAFNDANSNCVFDAGEQGYGYGYVIVTEADGQTVYANPDVNGFYDIPVLPGTYTVAFQLWDNNTCTINTCTTAYNDTFTNTGQVSAANNFAINSGAATFDIGVHIGYEGSAPGQPRQYWVYYYNYGQTAVANGTLTFVHDPNITLVNTTPAYAAYDAPSHTITWNIVNNLLPGQGIDAQHLVQMTFNIPASLPLGTELTAGAHIDPTVGDCDSSNNNEFVTDVVSASHDPNSKEVSPAGNLSASDTVLTYTIRFQNTGNAPANLIVVKDTLSQGVDPATVQPGASSAPYTWKLSGNGILTFTFAGINLVDSAENADSSQGYVVYTVQIKNNLSIGTQIKNTAYVYFDANPAVVTNTTNSLRSDSATGIHRLSTNVMTAQVIPNPVHNQARIQFSGNTGTVVIKLIDELGNIIASANNVNQYYMLDAGKLASGIYFYTAKDAAGNSASGKISIVH